MRQTSERFIAEVRRRAGWLKLQNARPKSWRKSIAESANDSEIEVIKSNNESDDEVNDVASPGEILKCQTMDLLNAESANDDDLFYGNIGDKR